MCDCGGECKGGVCECSCHGKRAFKNWHISYKSIDIDVHVTVAAPDFWSAVEEAGKWVKPLGNTLHLVAVN